MSLNKVINKNAVKVNLNAKNKHDAINALSELLYIDGVITNKNAFINDVYEREKEGETGIGGGVAIPHGKSDYVVQSSIAIGLLNHPIEWETLDGEPVKLIILFAVNKKNSGDEFIKMMSEVAKKISKQSFCDQLMQTSNEQELIQLFN